VKYDGDSMGYRQSDQQRIFLLTLGASKSKYILLSES